MAKSSSGKRIVTLIIGLIVMVGGFFGGFVQLFWMDNHDVGTILFFVLFVPMISFLIGAGIIVYGMKDSMPGFSMFGVQRDSSVREKSFVHEPPKFCKSCGANLSTEEIQWVGPLTVKCPYCGATHSTEKREV